MHQSIAILQMSSVELIEFAAHELDKNPFIEDNDISIGNLDKKSEIRERFSDTRGGGSVNQDWMANIANEKTIKEHITEQINISITNQRDRLIASYLLDSLQSSGYLNLDLNEISTKLQCNYKVVEGVLKILQSFDPPGIFARSLRECLEIQIREKNLTEPSLVALINNLDLLANGDFKKLSKLCNVNIMNLSSLIRQLKSLNPKPGNGFLVEQTRYKIPDVTLTFVDNGTAKLEINSSSMPNLRVNLEYYLKIKDGAFSKEDKEFARIEVESATTVVKSIEQRANTIIKVARHIVEEQMEFFTRGVMYLKPMTLNKIASALGLNESTISRSTANKYIDTPSGIYELKYFFSSGLSNSRDHENDVSSTKVKEIIKQLVMSEDPQNILSDDDLSAQLNKFNVRIARRTVAKYREALGIPTSAVRKRNRFVSTYSKNN
jgi:RNA polymerase sigma-54 factor